MIILTKIEIKGFRSFGNEPQSLDLSPKVNFIWAGNSQGKTSFTEGMEFLFTGNISRRDLLASSKDEFADALKNGFLSGTDDVYVEIEIKKPTSSHKIKRVLSQDFGKRNDCASKLYIDGKESKHSDLVDLGFIFNVPPLSTPILMQHCLSYLLTAKPQDRAEFFKAVFEVNDVELFRNTVEQAISAIQFPEGIHIKTIRTLSAIEEFKNEFSKILKTNDRSQDLESIVKSSVAKLLGKETTTDFDENLKEFSLLVEDKQKKVFPTSLFGRGNFQDWTLTKFNIESKLNGTLNLQKGIDSTLKDFVSLYSEIEALNSNNSLPLVKDGCPVCLSEGFLSKERIEKIKSFLKDNREYQKSLSDTSALLTNIKQHFQTIEQSALLPKFFASYAERKKQGFTIAAIKEFVSDQQTIKSWLFTTADYCRRVRAFQKANTKLSSTFKSIDHNNLVKIDFATLASQLADFESKFSELKNSEVRYKASTQVIFGAIQSKVSERTNTIGWSEVLALALNLESAKSDVAAYQAFTGKQKIFFDALEDIDNAKAKILENKFSALSSEIKKWWDLLRPEERSYFEHLKPRPQAKRNIDFKVSLTAGESGGTTVVRDAIAVFSQSQINCLGLASFLAKKMNGSNSFLILDDPVLTVDDDHRAHFIHGVIEEIIKCNVQLVLLTQCQETWSSLQNLYMTHSPSSFQFEMENPASGTQVVNKGDSAKAQLSAIKPLIRNNAVEIRKLAASKMRDAAERFCKELLVIEKTKEGEKVNILTYAGKTLEELSKDIQPYFNDASHPGKFKVIKDTLNPGNHDAAVPNKGALAVAFGDLNKFESDYIK